MRELDRFFFFEEGDDPNATAWVDDLGSIEDVGQYAFAYQRAAKSLLEHALPQGFKGRLVFPVLFLYRHCVELHLKHVILLGRILERQSEEFPITHDLDRLWIEAKPIIERTYPNGPSEDLASAERSLRRLREIDPDSFRFRYPVARDKSPSLPESEVGINLAGVKRVIGQLVEFLDGCACGLENRVGIKRELD